MVQPKKYSKNTFTKPSAENAGGGNGLFIQPKLKIGSSNDSLEQQANSVADHVIYRKPNSFSSINQNSKSAFSGTTSNLKANQIGSNNGNGVSMDSTTKSFMENSIGANFSEVKIHTDSEAIQMSENINAQAFTVGNDVFFNEGKYKPDTEAGQHLLAHELTHTIQQSGEKMIQKEDKGKDYVSKLDVDFKLLPPKLQFRLHRFLLAGDTSSVHLDYTKGEFKTSLAYKYGDALSANLKLGSFGTTAAWKPGSEEASFGLNYKRGEFSAGLSANPWASKYGLKLHYGANLLPFQTDMSKTFMAGGNAVSSLLPTIPAAFDDPIDYYSTHKDEIGKVTDAVDLVSKITDAGKKRIRFGADFGLSYDPISKVLITAKIGVNF
jgi:hypothetical protein